MIRIIILFVVSISYSQGISSDSLVYWGKNRKLNFEDFVLKKSKEEAGTKLAESTLSFEILVDSISDGVPFYSINTIFKKSKSWMIGKQEYVLRHEQVHFDIFEIYARKIQLEFDRLNTNNNSNKDDYISIYNELLNQCIAINEKFDDEFYKSSFWGTEDSNDNQIIMTENINDYVKFVSLKLPDWEEWVVDNLKKVDYQKKKFLTLSKGKFFDNDEKVIIIRKKLKQYELYNNDFSEIICELIWETINDYKLRCINKINADGCLELGDVIKVSIVSFDNDKHTVIYSNERCGEGELTYYHKRGW
jgi:hypothetical protein